MKCYFKREICKNNEAIYDRFQDKALDVLENTPEKLLEIKGITSQKLDTI